jgi:6-phosphogluconolactonase (cycloisomerase 2 family)
VNIKASASFLSSILLTAGLLTSNARAQSPTPNTFIPTGSMSTPRAEHTATLLPNGKVLVAGGTASINSLSTAELYDTSTGMFVSAGNLVTSRNRHTATLLANGKVLLAGGDSGATLGSTSAELYDPSSGTFSATGSMTNGRSLHTATLLTDGRVLVAGGIGVSGLTLSAELYDPNTGTFAVTGNMQRFRLAHTATLLPNGMVLITGGVGIFGTEATAEIYDPTTGIFTLLANSMTTFRAYHTATLLPNGKVLLAGGDQDVSIAFEALNTAELFDPATNTFTSTGPMTTPRFLHTATLLSNGQVLVAGGDGNTILVNNSAELYDGANSFASTGSMSVARDRHTATLLSNGNVLVTGGSNGIIFLMSAETYIPTPSPGRFAYVANCGASCGTSAGNVSAYTIDGSTGALTPVVGSPFPTLLPESVTVDPTGRFAYVANFFSADQSAGDVSAYAIDGTTGALTPVVGSPFLTGIGSRSVTVDSTGRFAYVTSDDGSVSAFAINGTTGALTAVPGSPFPTGMLPVSVTVDPRSQFAYVANLFSSNVSAYTIDGSTGALTPVAGSPFPVGGFPTSVTVEPRGQFAYVANDNGPSLAGNVSAFTINGTTGALTPIAGSPFPAGLRPKSLTVDPSGRFVYVANLLSNNVSTYAIDGSTGALTPVADSPFPTGVEPLSVTTTAGPGAPRNIPPTITSVFPQSGIQGQTITNFTANGTGFQSGAIVSFSGVAGLALNSSTVTATQITGNLDIAIIAAVGPRDVIVTNPDGQQARLSSGFTVTAAPPPPLPVMAVSPTALDFGTFYPNSPAATQTLTISNIGTAPLLLSGITSSNSAFTASAATMGPIATQGSTTVTVTVSPVSGTIGTVTGVLTVAANTSPVSVAMRGTSAANRPLVLLPIDYPISAPPLDIQPINNRQVGNTIVTDFILRNLTGTWYEISLDTSSPPTNAPNLVSFTAQQIPDAPSFLIGPNETLLKFPRDGTHLTFSPGQYLKFRATDQSLKVAVPFALDMFTRGVFGAELQSVDVALSTVLGILQLIEAKTGTTCFGPADQMLKDVLSNNPSAAALDDLLLLGCIVANSPTLVAQIGSLLSSKIGPAAADQWLTKIAPNLAGATIIVPDLVNFSTLMLPLMGAQLFAQSPGFVVLEVPLPASH